MFEMDISHLCLVCDAPSLASWQPDTPFNGNVGMRLGGSLLTPLDGKIYANTHLAAFNGQTAISMGLARQVGNMSVNASVSHSNGQTGAGIGVGWRLN